MTAKQMIAAIALLTAALVGCVEATSHDELPNGNAASGTVYPVDVTESQLIGRWVNAGGEVIDLRDNGVFVHTPATVLRAAGGAGTWHLQDFGGSQYLVTVRGGTSAQTIMALTATTLTLQPGGVYDLGTAESPVETTMCQGAITVHACPGSQTTYVCVDSKFGRVTGCTWTPGSLCVSSCD